MDVVHPDITMHLTLFNANIDEGVPQKLEHNDIKWIAVSEKQFDPQGAYTVEQAIATVLRMYECG